MSDPTPPHDLNTRAGQEVARIGERLAAQVELDEEQERAVTAALISALMAGVRLGAAEVAAQNIEQGVDVRLHLDVQNEDIGPEDIV